MKRSPSVFRRLGRRRALCLAGFGICLVGLSVRSGLFHPWISYRQCLADPERYDGRLVESFHEPKIGKIRADGFVLQQRDEDPVFVKADTAGLKSGEFIAFKAVFHKGRPLAAAGLRVADRRREKMAFSLVPAVAAVVLFLRLFRFNPSAFEFETKRRA
jgi:hypothetical protein